MRACIAPAPVPQCCMHTSPSSTTHHLHTHTLALNLPHTGLPALQVQLLVDKTLRIVELEGLQHRVVGSLEAGGQSLTVEQRKRLSIAVEL